MMMEYYGSNLWSCESSVDWDLHSFGVFNADASLVNTESPFSSNMTTTGYLQDAIDEWSHRCKRRRILSYPLHPKDDYPKKCLDSEYQGDPFENFSCLKRQCLISDDDPLNSLWNNINDGYTTSTETNPRRFEQYENISPSSSFHMNKDPYEKDASVSEVGGGGPRKKVAYPFDMVKPGGMEGEVTLDDINERILMRPTRPVRHPVGDLACNPCVFARGFGPSGKVVVALTRIHTQGRGTVTIIRTRG